MHPLRSLIPAAAGTDAIRRQAASAPVSRDVVRRFVAGDRTADAIRVPRDRPGVDATAPARTERNVRARRELPGASPDDCTAAFHRHDADLDYARRGNALLSGDGYPMFATHDPRLVRIVAERARRYDRKPGTCEYQMLFGVRQDEQRRLAREGETVRVHVHYGSRYGNLTRRLAGRPANTTFFARALVSNS